MLRVIDASVAVKWFVQEEDSPKALALLREVAAAPSDFAVPELFFFELANVLFIVAKGQSEKYSSLLTEVMRLGMHRFQCSDELLGEMRTFQARGLSGYDASYAALAKHLNGTWITADKKAHACLLKDKISSLL